jgi:hypothetical protein
MQTWVLSVPQRLRYFLEREPRSVTAILHLFLRFIEAHLRKRKQGPSAPARFGAVSVVHRFGSSLNRHIHYHCGILDGTRDFSPPHLVPAWRKAARDDAVS